MRISDGQNSKRCAATLMTRGPGACAAPAPSHMDHIRTSDAVSAKWRCMSEPPAEADVDQGPVGEQSTLVAQPRIVGLHGDIGIGVIGDAGGPRVSIEFLQRHVAVRHAMLGVEVLVTNKRYKVARRACIPDPVPC